MKKRIAVSLAEMGFAGTVDDFRDTLAAVKGEKFPGLSDEDLAFGKYESAAYCAEVRRRLSAPRLGRVFILRALMGIRKSGQKSQTA